MARVLTAGAPLNEALRLAAGANGDTHPEANALPQPALAEHSEAAGRLPPFMRYALWQSETGVGRVRALRMAAELYRASARRRADRVRLIAPLVLCAILGGGVTLLYGLSLFVPIIEMLRTLSA